MSRQVEARIDVIRLSVSDNVAVAARELHAGESVELDGMAIDVQERIPTGSKLAVARIAEGERVIKFGAPIGSATRAISPGQHVHVHNVKSDYLPTYTHEPGHRFDEEAHQDAP